jgi:hypothetical protein
MQSPCDTLKPLRIKAPMVKENNASYFKNIELLMRMMVHRSFNPIKLDEKVF